MAAYRLGESEAIRCAIARFILDNQSKIRSIARTRLATPRTVFDSDEVLATVLRRIDLLVVNGGFAPCSEHDVWGLISTTANNSSLGKASLTHRALSLVKDDGEYAKFMLAQLEACRDDDDAVSLVTRLMLQLSDDTDRQIIGLRLRGASHRVVAGMLGLTEVVVRARWSRALATFRDHARQWRSER